MPTTELKFVISADSSSGQAAVTKMTAALTDMGQTATRSSSEASTSFGRLSDRMQASAASMQKLGLALSASVTAPLAAIGAYALKAGVAFDDALDNIRVSTGATGRVLDTLEQDFRSVFASIPASAESVSTAISQLNSRLGLTGKPLQDLSAQMLELSRITKTDLNAVIQTTTRLFGDWGVSTDKMGDSLDFVFRASQQTGVAVDRIGALMVQYGAPLRSFGFSFEEAAAMMGKFEREGVNTELVMGSLRIALKKFSDEGVKDTKSALVALMDSIKNAASAGEASAIAFEHFGSRAGADMAAAIRQGKLAIGDLVKSLSDSKDTIRGAADATAGFAEKFELFKNRLLAAVEPIGTKLLSALEGLFPIFERLLGAIGGIADAFAELPQPVQTAVMAVAALAAAVGPILLALPMLASGVTTLVGALGAGAGLAGILGVLPAIIVAVGAAFLTWKLVEMARDIGSVTEKWAQFRLVTAENVGEARAMAAEFKSFGVEINTLGRTYDDVTGQMAGWRIEMERSKESVKGLGGTMKGEGLRAVVDLSSAIGKLGDASGKAAAGTRALTEEEKKLVASIRESIGPMNKLATELDRAVSLGFGRHDMVRNWASQIESAAEAQRKLTTPLSESAIKMGIMHQELNVLPRLIADTDRVLRQLGDTAMGSLNDGLDEAIPKLYAFYQHMVRVMELGYDADWGEVPKMDVSAIGNMADSIDEALASHAKDTIWKTPGWYEGAEDAGKKMGESLSNGISTILTDFSKDVADILFGGGSLWEKVKSFGASIGQLFVRTLTEAVFSPVQKLFSSLFASIGNTLSNLFKGKGLSFDLSGLGLGGAFGGALAGILPGAGLGALLGGEDLTSQTLGAVAGGAGGLAVAGGLSATMGTGALSGGVLGEGIGGFLSGAFAAIPVWGWAALGATLLGGVLYKVFSPDVFDKAVKETARDLGGTTVGKKAIEQFIEQIGLTQKTAEGIRKDIIVSPKFLTEIAYPAAQASGSVEAFLTSLENVQTVMGNINLRDPFEEFIRTGNANKLNEAYVSLFSKSQALLQIMPDFATRLAAIGTTTGEVADKASDAAETFSDLVDAFKETGQITPQLRAAVVALGGSMADLDTAMEFEKDAAALANLSAEFSKMAPAAESMYEAFLKNGIITEAFAAKIKALGGNLQAFQRYADLTKINSDFASLVRHFEDTGEILPALRQIFQDFGGDLKALDAAADLPKLKGALNFLGDFSQSLASMLPKEQTPIEKFWGGTMTEDLVESLRAAGMSEEEIWQRLPKLSDLNLYLTGWDAAVEKFFKDQEEGKSLDYSGVIAQALWSGFAGPNAQAALRQYQLGMRTLTPELLAAAKTALQSSFTAEGSYFQKAFSSLSSGLQTSMGNVNDALSAAFVNVAGNISTAMGLAAQAVATQLALMSVAATTEATAMRDAFTTQLTAMEVDFGTMSTAAIAALGSIGTGAGEAAKKLDGVTGAVSDLSNEFVIDTPPVIDNLTLMKDAVDAVTLSINASFDATLEFINKLKEIELPDISGMEIGGDAAGQYPTGMTVGATEPLRYREEFTDVPGAAAGGYVARAGIVRVHQGETIVPSSRESDISITVNVNAPVYGMDDLDRVIANSVRNVYRRGGLSFTGTQSGSR